MPQQIRTWVARGIALNRQSATEGVVQSYGDGVYVKTYVPSFETTYQSAYVKGYTGTFQGVVYTDTYERAYANTYTKAYETTYEGFLSYDKDYSTDYIKDYETPGAAYDSSEVYVKGYENASDVYTKAYDATTTVDYETTYEKGYAQDYQAGTETDYIRNYIANYVGTYITDYVEEYTTEYKSVQPFLAQTGYESSTPDAEYTREEAYEGPNPEVYTGYVGYQSGEIYQGDGFTNYGGAPILTYSNAGPGELDYGTDPAYFRGEQYQGPTLYQGLTPDGTNYVQTFIQTYTGPTTQTFDSPYTKTYEGVQYAKDYNVEYVSAYVEGAQLGYQSTYQKVYEAQFVNYTREEAYEGLWS